MESQLPVQGAGFSYHSTMAPPSLDVTIFICLFAWDHFNYSDSVGFRMSLRVFFDSGSVDCFKLHKHFMDASFKSLKREIFLFMFPLISFTTVLQFYFKNLLVQVFN